MERPVFMPADILIPETGDMESWSVIACDQFTSEREYWDRVSAAVSGKFSTLHMILPEAYLKDMPAQVMAKERGETMEAYRSSGIFRTLKNSFVYVERHVTGGIRHGLVGAIDLEAYDYSAGTDAPIRASERTVAERLPMRVMIRENASLELPHVMILIDDAQKTVIEPLRKRTASLEKLYDMELMEGGGHICGYAVTGEEAERVQTAFEEMTEGRGIKMIVGDGNHSLAAAKECWKLRKKDIPEEQWETDPARYALVEVVNVYDEGVLFEPIHRAVWCSDPSKFVELFKEKVGLADGTREVICHYNGKTEKIPVKGKSFGTMMEIVQEFLIEYVTMMDCSIDYIHDEPAAKRFADEGAVAFILPVMDKSDFFATVETNGIFPEKSFSIGHARDKRYYLECRQIKE